VPDWTLVLLELRGAVAAPHIVRLAALGVAAPLFSLWPHIGSPFAAAFGAAFLVLEPFYNNALNIWHGQLTAYALLPRPWESSLRAKGIATILLTLIVVAFFVAITAFVQPSPPTLQELSRCFEYLLSVLFPLLAIGAIVSRQQPRPGSGFGLDDAAGGMVMLIILGLVSIPWSIAGTIASGELLLLSYTVVAAAVWWYVVIPSAARRIHEQIPHLWHNTQTLSR